VLVGCLFSDCEVSSFAARERGGTDGHTFIADSDCVCADHSTPKRAVTKGSCHRNLKRALDAVEGAERFAEPAEVCEPVVEPAEVSEPVAEPAEGSEPVGLPGEGSEPVAEPAEGSEPVGQPDEGSEPVAEPAEASEPVGQPDESSEPVSQPDEGSKPVAEPCEGSEPVGQPDEGSELGNAFEGSDIVQHRSVDGAVAGIVTAVDCSNSVRLPTSGVVGEALSAFIFAMRKFSFTMHVNQSTRLMASRCCPIT